MCSDSNRAPDISFEFMRARSSGSTHARAFASAIPCAHPRSTSATDGTAARERTGWAITGTVSSNRTPATPLASTRPEPRAGTCARPARGCNACRLCAGRSLAPSRPTCTRHAAANSLPSLGRPPWPEEGPRHAPTRNNLATISRVHPTRCLRSPYDLPRMHASIHAHCLAPISSLSRAQVRAPW